MLWLIIMYSLATGTVERAVPARNLAECIIGAYEANKNQEVQNVIAVCVGGLAEEKKG